MSPPFLFLFLLYHCHALAAATTDDCCSIPLPLRCRGVDRDPIDIQFVHVPKSGGRTFAATFGGGTVTGNKDASTAPGSLGFWLPELRLPPGGISISRGHASYDSLMARRAGNRALCPMESATGIAACKCPAQRPQVTILREPVSRLLSAFYTVVGRQRRVAHFDCRKMALGDFGPERIETCLLYTSPSPRDS